MTLFGSCSLGNVGSDNIDLSLQSIFIRIVWVLVFITAIVASVNSFQMSLPIGLRLGFDIRPGL